MLMLATLALASPQTCTDVKRECRACKIIKGKQRCSNIGIACQPSIRVCRPKVTSADCAARANAHDR